MIKTCDLSKAIKDLHTTKMEGIRLATREKYLDLALATIAIVMLAVAAIVLF